MGFSFCLITISSIFQFFLLAPVSSVDRDYNLPALPDLASITVAIATLDGPYLNMTCSNFDAKNQIPKNFWITMKTVPRHYHELPAHIQQYLGHHRDWTSIIADDEYAHRFIKTVFANTSLLWAYENINPVLGAARADIWRYAVLYTCGGVYVDADATFHSHLDSYIKPDDKFIISTGSKPAEPCYQLSYHLSNAPGMFGNMTIVQWMIFSAPQHPFIAQALVNLVDVIKSIYTGRSVLLPKLEPFHELLCGTGPLLFTSSVHQMITMHSSSVLGFRYAGYDYEKIGGKFKESAEPEGPNHFKQLMVEGAQLLSSLEKLELVK